MKILKMALATGALTISMNAFAHDEGHGPKITDSGKYGGLVGPVVDAKDAKKGTKAALVYKAEMVKGSDDTIRVYLYDESMKPLDLAQVEKTATGVLGAKVKGKYQTLKFELKQEGNSYVGKAPKAPAKPFNLDFQFKEKSRELLTAFDNLD